MEVKELRLGNLIHIHHATGFGYEKGIHIIDDRLFKQLLEYETLRKRMQAVPLTEEWLLKWGFVNTKSGYELIIHSKRARLSVILRPDGIGMVGISGVFGLYDSIHYRHVHQLQNLYFALVGEEL